MRVFVLVYKTHMRPGRWLDKVTGIYDFPPAQTCCCWWWCCALVDGGRVGVRWRTPQLRSFTDITQPVNWLTVLFTWPATQALIALPWRSLAPVLSTVLRVLHYWCAMQLSHRFNHFPRNKQWGIPTVTSNGERLDIRPTATVVGSTMSEWLWLRGNEWTLLPGVSVLVNERAPHQIGWGSLGQVDTEKSEFQCGILDLILNS